MHANHRLSRLFTIHTYISQTLSIRFLQIHWHKKCNRKYEQKQQHLILHCSISFCQNIFCTNLSIFCNDTKITSAIKMISVYRELGKVDGLKWVVEVQDGAVLDFFDAFDIYAALALERIPENFVNKFRGELSATATITVLDGRIWQVGLKKIGNRVWFHNGWQEFVEHYYIRVGYFLIFRYEGNSGFFVHIFNLTTSEINYQSNAFSSIEGLNYGNQYNVFEEMEDDDSAEIMGSTLPCLAGGHLKNKLLDECGEQIEPSYTPPSLQNLFNGSQFKNCLNQGGDRNLHVPKGVKKSPAEIQATQEMRIHFNTSELKKSLDEVKLRSLDQVTLRIEKTRRKRLKPDPDEQVPYTRHEDAGMQFRFYENSSVRKRTVTAEERERAINAAKVFEPNNPFCRVVLRPSYVYRGCILYLPSCFAKHLGGVSEFIKLQSPDGRQWPVRCLYRGGRAKLSLGWYEFSQENNMGEGDVCVFELLKMRDVVLKVTVFRVLEETGLLVNQSSQLNVGPTKLIRI